MLAGLIFATTEATDRREALAATLPFGGATLIEFQARLLIEAGASQVLVAVARVTPELLGAAARIRRRGPSVDIVRSAAEAAAKAHPLARIVVIADGLVTTGTLLAPACAEGGDLLLVSTDTADCEGLERLDASSCWAGIAGLGSQRLADAAALPRDYDFQSSLLRIAVQAGATRLLLPSGAGRAAHGVERDSRSLATRGKAVFAAIAASRPAWVDRWLFAPLARFALPPLVARGGSPGLLLAGGGAAGLGGLGLIHYGWVASGLGVVAAALAAGTIGSMLGWLRGEDALVVWSERLVAALSALALLVAGYGADAVSGTATGSVLAVATVAAAGLAERLRGLVPARRWWGSPAAYPLLLIAFAAPGRTLLGLAAMACYAAATLAGAVEATRKKALART